MEQGVRLGRHRQELVAQALAHPGSLDEPREVGHLDGDEPPSLLARGVLWVVDDLELLVDAEGVDLPHPGVGRLGRERIVGDLPGLERHRVEEGRLSRVGLSD